MVICLLLIDLIITKVLTVFKQNNPKTDFGQRLAINYQISYIQCIDICKTCYTFISENKIGKIRHKILNIFGKEVKLMIMSWVDFYKLPENTKGKFKAQCLHCPSQISGEMAISSNFIKHLKVKHREEYMAVSVAPGSPKRIGPKPPTTITNYATCSTSTEYGENHPKQIQAVDSLIQYIAGDLLPLSTVSSENFQKFVKCLDAKFSIPKRRKLTSRLIKEKAENVRKAMSDEIHAANFICFTIDLWSNRQMKAFLGITGHYIYNWELKSKMIGCNRFFGRHTGENIRNEFDEVIASFELEQKVLCVISDYASNMVKTFKLNMPGFEKVKESVLNDDVDESEDSEEETGNDGCGSDIENDEPNEYFPKHLRCYAHSLQLVVKDGFKQCGREIQKALSKTSSIVSYVRRSISASDILEGENRLQTATVTRWNSQLTMVRSVLNVDPQKLEKIDTHTKLTVFERKLLSEICQVLEPFERATVMVQRDKSVSASLAIPTTLELKYKLNDLKTGQKGKSDKNLKLENQTVKFIESLETSLGSRLKNYEEEEEYVLATMLDPRFKLDWCNKADCTRNENLLLLKVKEAQQLIDNDDEDTSPPPTKVSKNDTFFSFMDNRSPARKRYQSGSGKMNSEVETYLNEDCIPITDDPLKYWLRSSSTYPILSTLAAKYLTIPCTSAPVERLFSIAGKIFRPDRSRMSDLTFKNLMMIKCNASN